MTTVMLVFGTRSEAIKICPLVNEFKTRKNINTMVCVTGQHRQMLDHVLGAFHVIPDYDLSIMKDGQIIYDNFKWLLEDKQVYDVMAHSSNPYGDDLVCKRIFDILEVE